MKKTIFLFLVLILVFMVKIAFTQNIPQASSLNMENPKGNEVLIGTITETLGEDFILGRAFMREADEVIYGQNCAVFALGTNTPEKFTREEFIAINSEGQVLLFDVLQNTWDGYHPTNTIEDKAQSPDYSAYSSLLTSYEEKWGTFSYKKVDEYSELYDVWGVNCIELADFDGDGIQELILVCMNEQSTADGTSTSPGSTALQIFTLEQTGEGQRVKRVGAFPLMQVELSPTVELAVVDNKVHLITGEMFEASYWNKTFWQLTDAGFVKAQEFTCAPIFDEKGYLLGEDLHINGKKVDAAAFYFNYHFWTGELVSTKVSNCTLENVEKLQDNNKIVREKLLKYAGNNAPVQGEKTFAVKFMGYTADWLGMPDISPYFTDEELFSLNHQDFGGNEMYLVKNNRHGRTYVYENIIDENGHEQVGRRLYESKAGEVLFFTCNESETRPNIVLLYVSPEREEFYFRPSLSLMDGSVELGKNAEALKVKN